MAAYREGGGAKARVRFGRLQCPSRVDGVEKGSRSSANSDSVCFRDICQRRGICHDGSADRRSEPAFLSVQPRGTHSGAGHLLRGINPVVTRVLTELREKPPYRSHELQSQRLPPAQDRLDNVRRQQRQPRHATDLGLVELLGAGDPRDGLDVLQRSIRNDALTNPPSNTL